MRDRYNLLEKQKNDSDNQIDYYKNAMKLFDIETLASDGKFEMAADKLLLIKDAGFKDGEKKKYDGLCSNILPKAAWNVYNEGMSHFWAKRYQEALGQLAKVQLYKDDFPYLDSIFYNMGVCYKNLEDSRKALDMFQKVIDSYPNSKYSLYSQSRINEITGRP
jgi:outer membrane protein assembly factor BamD (BamD/ComL family)